MCHVHFPFLDTCTHFLLRDWPIIDRCKVPVYSKHLRRDRHVFSKTVLQPVEVHLIYSCLSILQWENENTTFQQVSILRGLCALWSFIHSALYPVSSNRQFAGNIQEFLTAMLSVSWSSFTAVFISFLSFCQVSLLFSLAFLTLLNWVLCLP